MLRQPRRERLMGNHSSGSPTLISGVSAMVAVAAGQNHTVALTATGDVYAFGSNASGQIEEVLRRSGVCQVGDGTACSMRVISSSSSAGLASTKR